MTAPITTEAIPLIHSTSRPGTVETYFQCITTCSLDDGECVTRCVEQLRDSDS